MFLNSNTNLTVSQLYINAQQRFHCICSYEPAPLQQCVCGYFHTRKHSHTNLHLANIIYLYVCFRLHTLCTNMRWVFTITMLSLHQCMTVCVCASVNLVWYFCISVLQNFAKVVTPWKRGCRLSVSCQPQVEHEVNVKVCEQQNIQNKTGAGNIGDRG